jgi:ribose transport system ATP-binding protein
MSQVLVKMSGIIKEFPGVKALADGQFELRSGEVHALVGENGAGKSTLMKILTGVYSLDTGTITYLGENVSFSTTKQAQDVGINIIHQELQLAQDLTVAQNIFVGREPLKGLRFFINNKKLISDTEQLLKRLNIQLDPNELVSNLTVAKQQMVEIAKALSFNAKVLIMDEPTAALSDAEIEELFRIIRDLKKNGVGIVYISHRMNELREITDRITVMRDGKYIDTVMTHAVTNDEIISMMVGRTIYQEVSQYNSKEKREVVLEAKGLRRGRAVKDVSFNLHKGEILGIAGLVGAGRTELARLLFGADSMDAGEVWINGKKCTIRDPYDAVKQGIGYLSEDRKRFGCLVDMDVATNIGISSMVAFSSKAGMVKPKEIRERAIEMKEKLKIKTPHVDQQVKFLSGGNQQKVVIGKWLVRDCDILIFDEPTRGIDVGAKSEIYQLLNDLAAQGKSIIMISSELPEILRMSHRVLVMCEGSLTGILSREEASQEKIMKYATMRVPSITA